MIFHTCLIPGEEGDDRREGVQLFKPEGEPGAIRVTCGASRQFDELSADLF
jgi:hypothetical protein